MTERSHNIRAATILRLSHNNRRFIPEARGEDNKLANRSYRGSHRGGGLHHADDQTQAERRSSRVGRHHAEPTEDSTGRW